jgi:hypothetical protein
MKLESVVCMVGLDPKQFQASGIPHKNSESPKLAIKKCPSSQIHQSPGYFDHVSELIVIIAFQNILWKWSKYIDIKFEYGISTNQINDYNYFIIFIFLSFSPHLFDNLQIILRNSFTTLFFYYNLYQNKWCHFYYKVYGDCLFIVKCIRTYFNCFEYKLYNDCLHMLKGIITYKCCH